MIGRFLDRLFEPVWAGGWAGTRLLYAGVSLAFFLPRAMALADAYAAPDMVFSAFPFYLADHVRLTLRTAWILWVGGVLGLVGVLAGGRWTRPGVVLWLCCDWFLLASEAVNIKAHDRLGLWIGLGLLLSPASQRGLTNAWRSPASRWYLLLVYCGIYGSTGWLKLLEEPKWFTGDVLAYHLVHHHFAGGPIAAWLSGQSFLTRPMGWTTVIFEASFPLLCWFRRTNPWVLLIAASFHLGVAVLMNVGPFSFLAISAYPVLLHPEVARGLWERLRTRFGRSL